MTEEPLVDGDGNWWRHVVPWKAERSFERSIAQMFGFREQAGGNCQFYRIKGG
jgi:hypothetical protein